jgi:hypothetical protein
MKSKPGKYMRRHWNASGIAGGPRARWRPCRIRDGLLLGTLLAAVCAQFLWPPSIAAQSYFAEYRLKAGNLVNFLKFLEFPEELFGNSRAPIVIGIVGDDPLGPLLEQVVLGKFVQGRNLVIRNYHLGEDMRGAHILFIGASEKKRVPQILAGLQGSNVLTIADLEGFLEQGGMVQLVSANGGAHFAINLSATRRTTVKISSKVLSLARVVGGNAM